MVRRHRVKLLVQSTLHSFERACGPASGSLSLVTVLVFVVIFSLIPFCVLQLLNTTSMA
jgi:hypothetical protein